MDVRSAEAVWLLCGAGWQPAPHNNPYTQTQADLTTQERHDLLEVIEDRYQLRGTILTSQLPPATWQAYLAEPTSEYAPEPVPNPLRYKITVSHQRGNSAALLTLPSPYVEF